MIFRLAALILFISAIAVPIAAAAPPQQGPGEEPTKAPYVFPTPIFIPTYPGDNPAPQATAATRATPAVTLSPQGTYTVQSGDSPWTIAERVCGNGSRSALIMSANGISDSRKIRVGTVLKIPPECLGAPPAPTLAPTTAPVSSPPVAPTRAETPVPARTPVPAGGQSSSTSSFELVGLGLNVFSGFLFIGSILSGISAYAVYRRKVFIEQMTNMTRRLWLRK